MDSPLVSVIVPVFNGAEYLQECLESVLTQSYRRWEAIVADNCSTDGTAAIAEGICRREKRFRLVRYKEFVGQCENYNRAVALASAEARYVKILEADNWLMPECLERMVDVAMSDKGIGLVSCYYLHGTKLLGAGLPVHTRMTEGSTACRMHLLEDVYFFGAPTSMLFRSEALRTMSPVFQPGYFHDDADLCFRLLRNWRFGFAHQVLAFIREDNPGLFSKFVDFGYRLPTLWLLLSHYGTIYLTASERQARLKEVETAYRAQLGRALLGRRSKSYWDFHRRVFEIMGRRLRRKELLWPAAAELMDSILNPKSTFERLRKRIAPKPQVVQANARPELENRSQVRNAA